VVFQRRLVIDASVARSAGSEHSVFPVSRYCRDVLRTVLQYRHVLVMSSDIKSEWDKHESGFAKTWRVEMQNRKLVYMITNEVISELRNAIASLQVRENERRAMLKDVRLLEAALATDRRIISLDDSVRRLFSLSCSSLQDCSDIVWVNPVKTNEAVCLWLKRGANTDRKRRLGSMVAGG